MAVSQTSARAAESRHMTGTKIINTISDTTLTAYLQLARTEGIGPINFQRLMMVYADPTKALASLPDLARSGGRKKPLKPASKAAIEKEIAASREYGGQYLVRGEAGYPAPLAAIPDAPPVLAAFGHLHLLEKSAIAIVGARNASAAAARITQNMASGLAQRGLIVVSGLARGIDGVAHKHALASGTIAVIANGIDHYYPPENRDLQEQIGEQGLILCENPPGTTPQPRLFPRRNRIISGLSLGVIVIEAARRSGSLITARMAGEQGREVLSVPGSPLDARCLGSNNLIREGAHLVETPEDVLAVIDPLRAQLQSRPQEMPRPTVGATPPPEVSESERRDICGLLGAVPVMVDDLVEQSQLSVPAVHLILLELALAERLVQEPGGKISLID